MGKDKPRHNPHKKNNIGSECWYCEDIKLFNNELKWCSLYGSSVINICKGDYHNCCKVRYKIAASRSDIQKINNVEINKWGKNGK